MKRQKIFFGFQAVLLAGLLCMIVRDLRMKKKNPNIES